MSEERNREKLDAALALLERGYSVFPVHAPGMPLDDLPDEVRTRVDPLSMHYDERAVGKIPLVAWKPRITERPSALQVKREWRRWPTANIGAATGRVSGVVAIDADGEAAVRYAAERELTVATCLAVQTARGFHFHCRIPDGQIIPSRNAAVTLDDGSQLDVKGEGGYVLMPPSVHRTGWTYQFVDADVPPGVFPEWLRVVLPAKDADGEGARVLRPQEVRELLRGSVPGRRHNDAKTLIAHLFGVGWSYDQVRDYMVTWCQTCGADYHHVMKEVAWVWEREAEKRKGERPEVEAAPDRITFRWPRTRVHVEAWNVDDQGGLQAHLRITHRERRLHYGPVRLESMSHKRDLAVKLRHRTDGEAIDWDEYLETVYEQLEGAYRAFYRPVDLSDVEPKRGDRDVLVGAMPLAEAAIHVLFGDMASGKSTIALAAALALATGVPVGPFVPRSTQPIPVLIIDNENLSADENALKLAALCRGIGREHIPRGILWWHLRRPIQADKVEVHRLCQAHHVGFVVVDSFAIAAGGDPIKADSGIALYDALHWIGRTALVTAHLSKASLEIDSDLRTAYGSVMNTALPRRAWAVKATKQTDTELVVRLVTRKVNLGRRAAPQFVRFTYEGGDIPETIRVDVPPQDETVVEDQSITSIVWEVLSEGTEYTVTDLHRLTSELAGRPIPRDTVYHALLTLERRQIAQRTAQGGGKNRPGRWRIRARDDASDDAAAPT